MYGQQLFSSAMIVRSLIVITFVISVTFLARAWFYDSLWVTVRSEGYKSSLQDLDIQQLYHFYRRDMRLRPPVSIVADEIAERGAVAANFTFQQMLASHTSFEFEIGLVILERIKDQRTFDICQNQHMLSRISTVADSYSAQSDNGLRDRVDSLCQRLL